MASRGFRQLHYIFIQFIDKLTCCLPLADDRGASRASQPLPS
jgi:hypothetical protein